MAHTAGSITVIGAGAFGTATAHVLATNGYWVCLYTHEPAVAAAINNDHVNHQYLADVVLPARVWATTDPARAAQSGHWCSAMPVPYLRATLAPFATYATRDTAVLILSKGIEAVTGLVPSQMATEVLGSCRIAALSGPNFARELTSDAVAGAVVAAADAAVAQQWGALFNSHQMRITLSTDLIGVQVCGALKNIIALGLGMVTGAGGADNTRAYLLTQLLAEMSVVVAALGGQKNTVYGLAGVGDTVLSSLSTQGRNYRLGVLLGQGVACDTAISEFASPPEGLQTARALLQLCEQGAFSVPLMTKISRTAMGDALFVL